MQYISSELPGHMLLSSELCRHARAAGLYYAEQMYRLGYPFTTQLSEAIALTYTWSSPLPHALQVRGLRVDHGRGDGIVWMCIPCDRTRVLGVDIGTPLSLHPTL